MDGCLSGLNPKKRLFRSPEDYGMEEIRGKALYKLTSDYTISILQDWREKEDDTCYLLEADAKTVEYANGLIRMNAVDEIIIYITPCIIGTGDHFFKSGLFPTRSEEHTSELQSQHLISYAVFCLKKRFF